VWQAWWSLDVAEELSGRRFLELVDVCAEPEGMGKRGNEVGKAKLLFQAAEPPDISLGTGVGQNPEAGLEDLSAWSAADQGPTWHHMEDSQLMKLFGQKPRAHSG
jgi:hypothetical protein